MASYIYRYEVPVDGKDHEFVLHGSPLHVGCRDYDRVEFWAVYRDGSSDGPLRRFQVVGTGHELPKGARYIGTAPAPGGTLVWHLIELLP